MSTAVQKNWFTDQQRAALGPGFDSVSLAAGAGCGKTFVLTERFLSYLDPKCLGEKAELSELVAITFTEAAAREMRDRIRRRCYQCQADAEGPELRRAWQHLLRILDTAQISTIHSFCGRLLRSHAVELGLDPRFEQLDQPSADLLRLRSLDDRLRQLLLAEDERLLTLATRFGLRRLREHLVQLLGENLGPVLDRWRDAKPEELVAAWEAAFEGEIRPRAVAELIESDAARNVIELCRAAEVKSPELSDLFKQLLGLFAELESSPVPSEVLDSLKQLCRVQGPGKKGNWVDAADYERFRDAAQQLRDVEIKKNILLRETNPELLLEAAQTGVDLLNLVEDVANCYKLAKERHNALEFDDLLSRAHQLLTQPQYREIQQKLTRQTRLLLVDEFQDTDPLQVEIVQALCGGNWQQGGLFVVGDFKQSIYRFRGAEPTVSNQLRAALPRDRQLSLTTNFRSQGAVLDFVNALFCEAFAQEYEPLRPSREQQTPLPAVEFLWCDADVEDDEATPAHYQGALRSRRREARFIARRIAQLIDSGEPMIVEAGQLRPLRQGDIAILFRALSDVAVYEEALREQGLDYYLAGGHAFYAQQEIRDVLHLLRCVCSEADELSLAGVLRSPVFALEDETLFWLVEECGSLHAGLFGETLPEQLADGERAKVLHAARVLQELRGAKDRLLIAELLTLAINLTGYDAVLLTEFLGERKLANLHKLVEQARQLDHTNSGDVSGFVTQLSEAVNRPPKEPLAATAVGDVVRLMTIHNAKGLEFPLVVVPDLNRGEGPTSGTPVFSPELGPLVSPTEKCRSGWEIHHLVERQEEQAEADRLLYVACTRAADYLILSSSVKDIDKPKSYWLKFLNQRFNLATGECRAALPAGYNVPQVRVLTKEPASDRKPAAGTRGRDLAKLVAEAEKLAQQGRGEIPPLVAEIPPHAAARRSFSFSRLSGQLHRLDPARSEPEEETPKTGLDPRGRGTLVHEVLERIDHSHSLTEGEVLDLCAALAPRHFQEKAEQAAAEVAALVESFLRGGRAGQLAQSACVLREVEFILPWQVAGDARGNRYLQGVMDCLYQDPQGGWHLVDYKSNQIAAAEVSQEARLYEVQMFVYSLACEQALGVPPVEQTLCFLSPGTEYSFQWAPVDRVRLTAELDRAIQAVAAEV